MWTSSSHRNVICSCHHIAEKFILCQTTLTHSHTMPYMLIMHLSLIIHMYCLCFPNIIIFNQCCSIRNDGYFIWLHLSNSIKTANTIVWPTLRKWQWVSVKNESLRQKRWFQFSHCELSMTWLTVTGYLCHKWRRICSVCRNHNLVFSSFMTYYFICKKSNTTGATNGARTAYPWFLVALSLVFCVIFVVHCFSFCLFRFVVSDYPFGFFKLFWKPLN